VGGYLLYRQLTAAGNKSIVAMNTRSGASRVWLTTVILMFSSSPDSIAVILPLLAESGSTPTFLIILIYLLRSILWCGISVKVSSNTELAQRISDQGEKLVPWVMVAVGIYVMSNTDTDSLPAGIT